MDLTLPQFAVYTLLVFLAGMALPLLVLRGALQDREDNCFLTFVLASIVVIAVGAVVALFLLGT
jgi:hypothetical protein